VPCSTRTLRLYALLDRSRDSCFSSFGGAGKRNRYCFECAGPCDNEAPMKARFIEPILLLRCERLPEDADMLAELDRIGNKLTGGFQPTEEVG
jgi:hypothetical protein